MPADTIVVVKTGICAWPIIPSSAAMKSGGPFRCAAGRVRKPG